MNESKLLICPECGKQVSRMAKFCPNCGCPIDYIISSAKKAVVDKTGFREKADNGDPVAQANYASCLANGTNIEKNPKLAKEYAEKSARQYNPYGMYVYAVTLVNPDTYGGAYESRLAFLLLLVASKYNSNASKMLAEWFRDGNYPLEQTYEEYYDAILNRNNPTSIDYDFIDLLDDLSIDSDWFIEDIEIDFNNEYGLIKKIDELFDEPLDDDESSSDDIDDEEDESYSKEHIDDEECVEDEDETYDEPVEYSASEQCDGGIEEIDESYFEEDTEIDNGYRDDKDYSED